MNSELKLNLMLDDDEEKVSFEDNLKTNTPSSMMKAERHLENLFGDNMSEDSIDNRYENDSMKSRDSRYAPSMKSYCDGRRSESRFQQNKTFSNDQIREIERKNAILMGKILSFNKRQNQYTVPPKPIPIKVTSAAVNRKKAQQKIDWENQILLRKIQTVKPCIARKK